ncbi:MAG TPA: hypothetical protein VK789_16220 [Bryobacteraceae bacterium]|jgi:hypothetical protein|nr:hypothetical protein [Bryobacteraceae bacterium]
MENSSKTSTIFVILFAWLVLAVPFVWGMYNTMLNSMQPIRPAQTQTLRSPR